jgi:hypothetical protein
VGALKHDLTYVVRRHGDAVCLILFHMR